MNLEIMAKNLESLEKKLGLKFKNKDLLKQSFIHRSYLNEHPDLSLGHNERLEFLGDAVLEFVVTNYLYQKFDSPEGELTSWRSSLVNSKKLAALAEKFNLYSYLYLSKGELATINCRAKMNILANTFEALIGAIYLDQGLKKVEKFVKKTVIAGLPKILKYKLYQDAKSIFQEKTQADFKITPVYRILKELGPDHRKTFFAGVFLKDKLIAQGRGFNKQEAETKAAQLALKKYRKICI